MQKRSEIIVNYIKSKISFMNFFHQDDFNIRDYIVWELSDFKFIEEYHENIFNEVFGEVPKGWEVIGIIDQYKISNPVINEKSEYSILYCNKAFLRGQNLTSLNSQKFGLSDPPPKDLLFLMTIKKSLLLKYQWLLQEDFEKNTQSLLNSYDTSISQPNLEI